MSSKVEIRPIKSVHFQYNDFTTFLPLEISGAASKTGLKFFLNRLLSYIVTKFCTLLQNVLAAGGGGQISWDTGQYNLQCQ